jgi:hypothetical protein
MATDSPQANVDVYSMMASIVRVAFDDLLKPLEKTRNAEQLLESTTAEEFFRDFLIHADAFAEKSSQEFAKTLRQFSAVPEVRGTPTTELAKQIRKTCFERLDRILSGYVAALRDLNLDMSITGSQLAGSSVIDAAFHGAAVGQLAGGLGSAGKNLGTFNAIWKGADELLRQGALAVQQLQLLQRARRLPYEKIAEFLDTSASLPEELLDYGCAKCFGGGVDFGRQKAALESISSQTTDKLKEAVSLVRAIPVAEEKKVAIQAVKAEEKKKEESKHGCAGCLGLLALCFLGGGLAALFTNTDSDQITGDIVVTVIGVGLAIGAGSMYASKKKPTP